MEVKLARLHCQREIQVWSTAYSILIQCARMVWRTVVHYSFRRRLHSTLPAKCNQLAKGTLIGQPSLLCIDWPILSFERSTSSLSWSSLFYQSVFDVLSQEFNILESKQHQFARLFSCSAKSSHRHETTLIPRPFPFLFFSLYRTKMEEVWERGQHMTRYGACLLAYMQYVVLLGARS